MLFVKSGKDAARRLATTQSALDDLLEDTHSLSKSLSHHDQNRTKCGEGKKMARYSSSSGGGGSS
jgi:hypothetical protein